MLRIATMARSVRLAITAAPELVFQRRGIVLRGHNAERDYANAKKGRSGVSLWEGAWTAEWSVSVASRIASVLITILARMIIVISLRSSANMRTTTTLAMTAAHAPSRTAVAADIVPQVRR